MSEVEQRRAWAAAYIQDARTRGHAPRYGTTEWHNLTPTDPLRWAAVIIAAECWASDGDNLSERLAIEITEARYVDQQEADWFAAVAADVRRTAGQHSHAELLHRRGVIDDQQLQQHQHEQAAFVAGLTHTPPAVPTAQEPPQ